MPKTGAMVLEGEVVAVMDVGRRVMRAGDVLIQRGTHHAWANRGDRPCRIAFILVDAEPLWRRSPLAALAWAHSFGAGIAPRLLAHLAGKRGSSRKTWRRSPRRARG
jgi:hypothetical protein